MYTKGLVSVVVPIYKVEAYIHRCIDSIIHQTYKNLEIILVDDGSPDHCGEIADQYREKDSRIKVIHKENGGLSDARNYGMKRVTGEYTMFVDSDDWLDTTMIEYLISNCINYEADVAQSAFYYAYDDRLLIDRRYFREDDQPKVLDNSSLMYELVVNERVKNFAWGKLYKTELIKDLPFKKGVLFEDVFWAHHVMHRVTNYLILHHPKYNYYQRDDSIVSNYTPKNLDIIKGLQERHRFIEKNYEELVCESYKLIFKMCLIHYNLLLRNKNKDPNGLYRKAVKLYIKDNYKKLVKSEKVGRELWFQLKIFKLNPNLLVLTRIYNKFIRVTKIAPNKTLERV